MTDFSRAHYPLGSALVDCIAVVQFMAQTLTTISDGVGAQAQAANEISHLQLISTSAGAARSASEMLEESAQAMKRAVEHFRTECKGQAQETTN